MVCTGAPGRGRLSLVEHALYVWQAQPVYTMLVRAGGRQAAERLGRNWVWPRTFEVVTGVPGVPAHRRLSLLKHAPSYVQAQITYAELVRAVGRQVAERLGNAGPWPCRVRDHGGRVGVPARGRLPLLEHALEVVQPQRARRGEFVRQRPQGGVPARQVL